MYDHCKARQQVDEGREDGQLQAGVQQGDGTRAKGQAGSFLQAT